MAKRDSPDMLPGKEAAAEMAVQLVRAGMTVGLGSGSTSSIMIRKLGEMVQNGLHIRAVASSEKSDQLARQVGIPIYDPGDVEVIDIALDGADEVDTKGNLIKGGGGSLLREKIIAYASRRFHVLIDESKIVERLGSFPLPVEITPFAVPHTLQHIRSLNADPTIRMMEGKPFTTDNGNYVCDCRFAQMDDLLGLDVRLKMIPGVVETGLFSARVVTSVFVGYRDGTTKEIRINQ
jgi:ribose 5-phosphate isomerase A